MSEEIRAVCTCFFGRLCQSTHKTWEDFRNDKELQEYCWSHYGYACPYCGGTHLGSSMEDCQRQINECRLKYNELWKSRT